MTNFASTVCPKAYFGSWLLTFQPTLPHQLLRHWTWCTMSLSRTCLVAILSHSPRPWGDMFVTEKKRKFVRDVPKQMLYIKARHMPLPNSWEQVKLQVWQVASGKVFFWIMYPMKKNRKLDKWQFFFVSSPAPMSLGTLTCYFIKCPKKSNKQQNQE